MASGRNAATALWGASASSRTFSPVLTGPRVIPRERLRVPGDEPRNIPESTYKNLEDALLARAYVAAGVSSASSPLPGGLLAQRQVN
jgi:hypothetical protein